ncbi:MAG: hypothetical protein PHX07_03305 [Candidatus Marinimicrobia bacterium]|nr:hypothetical protein [Candidatus Neomarinimicrobiota bacterium]MDD5709164.1 hypothetical protein [Candidatus Neomarinimicrobiota bacterium]
MQRCSLLLLTFVLLLSCAPESGLYSYRLENSAFPHPEREAGFSRNGVFYPAETHYRDPRVAVQIPKAYRKGRRVDLLVHFHGWNNHIDRCIGQFELDIQLEASGRNMLLIVPEGPRNAPDSFYGKLCEPGGFRRFLDELLDSLQNDGLIQRAEAGSIILSGHSGAYVVIANILRQGGCTEKIREVFLFDGLYALEDDYLNWLLAYPGRFSHIYTQNGGTMDNSLAFMSRCDSLGLPYVHANTADLETMPESRILMLYSDLSHSAVIAERQNLLKLLKRL